MPHVALSARCSTYLLIRTFLLDNCVRDANAVDTNHAVLFLAKLLQVHHVVRLIDIKRVSFELNSRVFAQTERTLYCVASASYQKISPPCSSPLTSN